MAEKIKPPEKVEAPPDIGSCVLLQSEYNKNIKISQSVIYMIYFDS